MDSQTQTTIMTKENLDDDDLAVLHEVAQLKRTLDVRTAEIALAVERARIIEENTEQIRRSSLTITAKKAELEALEEALRKKEATNEQLRRGIEEVRQEIISVHQERAALRRQRVQLCASLRPLTDDVIRFVSQQEISERRCKPDVALAALLGMANETVNQFDAALATYAEAEKKLTEQTDQVQEVHRSCLAEVNAAATEKELQKEQLEKAWQREQRRMEHELKLVTARAHEASFHRHRGTSSGAGAHVDPKAAPANSSSVCDAKYIRELRGEVASLQRDLNRYADIQRSEAYAAAQERRDATDRLGAATLKK